jgi:hypothetical protein
MILGNGTLPIVIDETSGTIHTEKRSATGTRHFFSFLENLTTRQDRKKYGPNLWFDNTDGSVCRALPMRYIWGRTQSPTLRKFSD